MEMKGSIGSKNLNSGIFRSWIAISKTQMANTKIKWNWNACNYEIHIL